MKPNDQADTGSATGHESVGAGTECPECGGSVENNPDTDEAVCADCGLVVEADQIDHGPEWRDYGGEEAREKRRAGPALTELRHDRGFSRTMGDDDKDAHGNKLSNRKQRKLNRLRTWDRRIRQNQNRDKALREAIGEVKRMGSALGLPHDTRETAAVMFRKAHQDGCVVGRSIEGVASACLYAASRRMKCPRSIDEVAHVSRVEGKEISRAYRYIARELGLGVDIPKPQDFLGRFTSELDVDREVEQTARDLLDEVEGTNFMSGKDPTCAAAGAIYAAGIIEDVRITQQEIAAVADVSEVSIRSHYKGLFDTIGKQTF